MASVRRAALLGVIVLLGCTGQESANGKTPGGTLVISIGGDPDALVPSLLQTTAAAEMVDLIYDRLADIGDSITTVGDRGFTPRLADHWPWSSDSLSIAFHLNPNARWHDGVPV